MNNLIRSFSIVSIFVFNTIIACTGNFISKETSSLPADGEVNFIISSSGKVVPLYASSKDYPGVLRVLKTFQADVKRVTDIDPTISLDVVPKEAEIIIIGTIGKSPIIDELIEDKKIDVKDVAGKWDSYLRQVIENPYPGIDRALVIAGSNKRGTIYGMFDISKQIGVSPWYWWADVPVKKQKEVSISALRIIEGEPKVKYRGIFLNDEAPALTGWVFEKFGGFNSKFYEKVFEKIWN